MLCKLILLPRQTLIINVTPAWQAALLTFSLYFPVTAALPSTEELRSLLRRNLSSAFHRRIRRRAAPPADLAAARHGASRHYTRFEFRGRESAAIDRRGQSDVEAQRTESRVSNLTNDERERLKKRPCSPPFTHARTLYDIN